jgi:hypothetical protein
MGEWYRGIAVGGPGPVASDVHDFGPGTYLTDNLGVAKDYGKFRADDSNLKMNQRTAYPAVLYGNFAEESLGPILDLTSGPDGQAWREFEETSFAGMTNRQIMRTNPGKYGPMFKDWATRRGLNLNQYAAIIGPEYLRGGRQMCIRNPSVADQVVASMVGRSIYAPPPPVRPLAISMTYSIRGQANGHALVVAFMAWDAVLNHYNTTFQEAATNSALKRDLQSVRDWQAKYPGDGGLIVITFRRTILNSEFMQNKVLIQPGDAFEYSSIHFAASPEEAIKQMSVEKEAVQGDTIDGPYKTVRRKQCIWIVPRGPDAVLFSPVGKWQVSIGNWKGWFVFRNGGGCAWSETGGPEHQGTWKNAGKELQWTYSDDPPGWERIFHAPLPLKSKTSGEATIKGVNHGYYTMSKVT